MEVKKASHCAYDTHDPIVFSVKYRKALLNVRFQKKFLEIAEEVSKQYEMEFDQVGCDASTGISMQREALNEQIGVGGGSIDKLLKINCLK